MKKRVAILTGGESSERDIALQSAEAVKNALTERFDVVYYDFPKALDKFLAERHLIDVAIPVFHGRGGEDGTIQGFLRTLKIPFLFSDLEAQAIAADKSLAKTVVAKAGVMTPRATVVSESEKAVYEKPVVIKPLDGGSSIGVSIVKDKSVFAEALREAFKQSSKVIIEDYVKGDEYTVPVVDKAGAATALSVIAIKPKTEFFDIKSKYDPLLVDEICPAVISDLLAISLKGIAIKAHQAIGARHVSRSDFIVDQDGAIWFLEINTIPGMTVNSLLPKALKVAGINFGELFESWIKSIL